MPRMKGVRQYEQRSDEDERKGRTQNVEYLMALQWLTIARIELGAFRDASQLAGWAGVSATTVYSWIGQWRKRYGLSVGRESGYLQVLRWGVFDRNSLIAMARSGAVFQFARAGGLRELAPIHGGYERALPGDPIHHVPLARAARLAIWAEKERQASAGDVDAWYRVGSDRFYDQAVVTEQIRKERLEIDAMLWSEAEAEAAAARAALGIVDPPEDEEDFSQIPI